MELVISSRNPKKTEELRELLAPLGVVVRSAAEFPDLPEVEEDGRTFAENAAKKATQTARLTGRWALGEDSGLEVEALGGAPGVYSARFSGSGATDESNNAKLMAELAGVPPERRGARYVCHVALADPSGTIRLSIERTCRGRITTEPRGSNGFGYDPYFLIPEYHRTFGELSPLVKRQLSHRGRALAALLPEMKRLLAQVEPAA
jgi:XTP/dITP diphosphohydrolase